jgi:hypothetical protein
MYIYLNYRILQNYKIRRYTRNAPRVRTMTFNEGRGSDVMSKFVKYSSQVQVHLVLGREHETTQCSSSFKFLFLETQCNSNCDICPLPLFSFARVQFLPSIVKR